MIKRFAPWATVMSLMMTLLLPDLPQISQGREADTPAQETENCTATSIPGGDEPVDRDVSDACDTPAPNDTGVLQRDGEAQNDNANPCADGERENCPEPSTASTDQNDNADRDGDGTSDRDDNCPDSFNQELTDADADGAGDTCDADAAQRSNNVSNENQHLVQAAESPPPTVVEVYCDIPDVNSPDQRIVGTYVDSRSGYGDPIVTFTLHDLNGNVINATGSSPMPSSNPITASPPYPNNWEWGPGGYSQLTVSAVYPSLAPASYPDASSSVTISCVPDAPTPTPPPAPTTDPLVTPPPTPTPASYIPTFTTEMKDTAGNTILDGATVSPGTGIYDIATISGIPPGTAGTVLYQLFRGNCSVYLGLVGNGHNVVADVNGVAVAPSSSVFTVPGIPGGFYDWRIIYLDASTGSVYSGCGLETFYVPPPLPSSGTGSARLTCFVREPAEPGRAGYKVNVSPLPATGSVEVNVTLLLGENLFEYATVTLPPGTAQDLEFYGAYTFAWVNVVYRDAAGEIYAVVNLEGACAATPGPTPTPGPTQTVTPIATTTPTPPATSTPTSTSTLTPSPTQTSTDVASSTPTPSATLAATSTMTPTTTPAAPTSTATNGPTVTLTNTPATTPAPTSESGEKSLPPDPTPGVTGLPTTGSGDNHSNEKSLLLFATLCAIAAVLLVTSRMEIRRGGRPS